MAAIEQNDPHPGKLVAEARSRYHLASPFASQSGTCLIHTMMFNGTAISPSDQSLHTGYCYVN